MKGALSIRCGSICLVGLSFSFACQLEDRFDPNESKVLAELERKEQAVLRREDLPHDPDLLAIAKRYVVDTMRETDGPKPRVYVVSAFSSGNEWCFGLGYYRDKRYVDELIGVALDGKSLRVLLTF